MPTPNCVREKKRLGIWVYMVGVGAVLYGILLYNIIF